MYENAICFELCCERKTEKNTKITREWKFRKMRVFFRDENVYEKFQCDQHLNCEEFLVILKFWIIEIEEIFSNPILLNLLTKKDE